MEFQFNVNEYFKRPVVEIGNTLLPPDFAGDRRALWNTVNKVAEVVNEMGEASAHAQGLNKPITTAERLRHSDQNLYLLIDPDANNGNGAVTGMLKIGRKGLYVFDREGQHYQVTPPCVLDFYVHEKRQRSGFGKKLFEYMLEKENLQPHNLAIDRPSEKFLNFLNKHYHLESPIKQMNNYVVFDGFFPDSQKKEITESSPISRTNGLQSNQSPNAQPMYGRYGAPRPPCSMGQIIHNTTSQKNSEPTSPNDLKTSPDLTGNVQVQPTKIDHDPQPLRSDVPRADSNQYDSFLNHPGFDSLQKQTNPSQNRGFPLRNQIVMFPEKEIIRNDNTNNPCQVYQMSQFVPNTNITQQEFQRYPNYPSNDYHQQQQMMGNVLQQQVVNRGFEHPQFNHQPYQMANHNSLINEMPRSQFSENIGRQIHFQQPLEPRPRSGIYHYPERGFSNLQPYPTGVDPGIQLAQQRTQFEASNQPYPQSMAMNLPQYTQNVQTQPIIEPNYNSLANNSFNYQYPNAGVSQQSAYNGGSQYINHQPSQQLPNYASNMQTYHSLPQPPAYSPVLPHGQVQIRYENQSEKNITPKAPVQAQNQKDTIEEQKIENEQAQQPDTVHSLLQVDPKYFKFDLVQSKQPSHVVTNHPVATSRQKDTVASLMNAEQEYFENGILREEYRVPPQPAYYDSNQDADPKLVTQRDSIQFIPQPPLLPQTSNANPSSTYARQPSQYVEPPRHLQNVAQESFYQQQLTPVRTLSDEPRVYHQSHSRRADQNFPTSQQPCYYDVNAGKVATPMTPASQYGFQREPIGRPYSFNEQFVPSQSCLPVEQKPCETGYHEEKMMTQQNDGRSQHIIPQQVVDNASKVSTDVKCAAQKSTVVQGRQQMPEKMDISANDVNRQDSEPATIRQSSYIPNDLTMHPEGPNKASDFAGHKTSEEEIVSRKKNVSGQYGLNDVDMRRKEYKSAIIKKRPTEVQELDLLEYGYPPQISKKRPPPRNILTMRGR